MSELKTIILPSRVGMGATELGMLSLGTLGRGRSVPRPHTVSWGGVTYLVGPHVERFAQPVERMNFLRLSDGSDTRAITYTTLGLLLGEGDHAVSLMVGLPVQVMANTETARQTLSELRGWLAGEHRFQVNGKEVRIQMERVQAMAQPAGTFFAWGMNDEGQWVRSTDDLKALVGICDIGFNTLDLFGVQGGQVIAGFTGGDTAGIRRAADLVIRHVREKYDVRLSRHEADALLRDDKPTLQCAAGAVDLSSVVQQALGISMAQIADFINSRWESGGQFRYKLFTGGGAALLREHLLRAYPSGLALPDAVTANALGLARYARRAWKSTPTVIGLDPGFGGFKAVCLKS